MNLLLRRLALFAGSLSVAFAAEDPKNCGCACCADKPKTTACCCVAEPAAPQAAAAEVKRHPLKGVVTSVYSDRSALMVKHEEIPGVMRAMTMLFKVDAATLGRVKQGDTVTGQMSRQGDDWVLENVQVVAAKKG